MKQFLFDSEEIHLILTALRYTKENGYTYEIENDMDLTEYNEMKALLDRLTSPVKKKGYIAVWEDGQRTPIFNTFDQAKDFANHSTSPHKIVPVSWEE